MSVIASPPVPLGDERVGARLARRGVLAALAHDHGRVLGQPVALDLGPRPVRRSHAHGERARWPLSSSHTVGLAASGPPAPAAACTPGSDQRRAAFGTASTFSRRANSNTTLAVRYGRSSRW